MAEEPANKPTQQRKSALWTMFGTWVCILVFAIATGGFADYWKVLSELLSGNVSIAQVHSGTMVRMAPIIAAMVASDLLVMIPLGILVAKLVKLQSGDHAVSTMFDAKEPKEQYLPIMGTLTAEELFARWLFLGVIGGLSWFSSGLWFYVLFFVGNALWAGVHLLNLNHRKIKLSLGQKAVFVAPQFVGGILITAIYVPYGLLGAFIAHVVYDMVLFAGTRVDVFNRGEKQLCVLHAVVGTVAAVYFGLGEQSVLDMKLWLTDGITQFALPGWGFWDYTTASVMLYCYCRLLLELLLFDHHGGTTKREVLRDWISFGTFLLASHLIVRGTLGLTYLSMAGVVMALSILAAAFAKTSSGSGVARVFWESLLISSLLIATIIAIGNPRQILVFVAIIMALHLVDSIIRYYDTDELPAELTAEDTNDAGMPDSTTTTASAVSI